MLDHLDAVLLARLQFAFTMSFHIVFPGFTIGLAAFVATLEIVWLKTGKEHFARLARFWTKIFAIAFAMGVVSGIMMSYQFGTNWSRFSTVVGNVLSPIMAYEVLTAFFLEATFLGILLFGWHRVPRWLHVTSAILVAVGTSISAFWILAANSWMHTPAGHEVVNGIAYPVDWLAVIFNPSFPYRLVHMLTACYLTTSLVVLAVGARYLVAGKFGDEARTMMRMGLGMVAILAPLQLVIGDLHGLNTAKHQPAKVAAMEAHWDGSKPAPLVLFAWPDKASESNLAEVSIPRLGSFIITHDFDGRFPGLKDFAPADRPPVVPVFFAFRLMVGIGVVMIAIGLVGAWLWRSKRLFDTPAFLRPVMHAWPLGFVAIIAGWIVTEVGRQPWIATGVLRTADAASPLQAHAVATSFVLIIVTYSIVFSVGVYYMNKLIRKGPVPSLLDPPAGVPNRPLSGATEAAAKVTGR
ncbi:MAG TPA: cytochrome ubiquinol oxidase subunit I [Casimicrobiaceae bacterium]|nr:cytochrome ubiquinol oxidase subunit I [Casimicrobiaceae bacterium]